MSNTNLSKTKNQIIEVMIITDLDYKIHLDRKGNIVNSFQVLGRGIVEDMVSGFREDFFQSPSGIIIGTALGGSSSRAQGSIAANVMIFETAQVMQTPVGLASSSTSSASASAISDPS